MPPPGMAPPGMAPPEPAMTPPSGVDEDVEPTLAPTGGMVACPSCGTQNPANFKFCGSCGSRLEGAAMPAAPAPAPSMPSGDGSSANLVLIRPDGSEGGAFSISEGTTTVGRSTGQIFSADAYLSPNHATFTFEGGRMVVRDEESLNGIYRRIPAESPVELESGDVIRMGQELVRVEFLDSGEPASDGTELMGSPIGDAWGRVALIVGDGQLANAFLLTGDGVVLGRERGDVLFPEDGYVSGTHVRLHRDGDKIVVTDLNSSNGTFLRVSREQDIKQGDYILMGQQLFRVDF